MVILWTVDRSAQHFWCGCYSAAERDLSENHSLSILLMITRSLYMRTLCSSLSKRDCGLTVRLQLKPLREFTHLIAFCPQRTLLKGSNASHRVHCPFICAAAGYGKKKMRLGLKGCFMWYSTGTGAFGQCQSLWNWIDHRWSDVCIHFVFFYIFKWFAHTAQMTVCLRCMCWNI